MDDRLKESISALMDEEANELELQRILSHKDKDEVHALWKEYHLARDVMTSSQDLGFQVDVSDAVSSIIDSEEIPEANLGEGSHDTRPELSNIRAEQSGVRKKAKRFESRNLFALAASVAFAFAVFWQGNLEQPFTDTIPQTAQVAPSASDLLVVSETNRQPKIHSHLSDDHAKQFNQYLLRHAEHSVRGTHSGMMPLARVASINSVGI